MASQPSAPTIAVAALSAASALCLDRVFGGSAWMVPVVGAAVLPVLVLALADRFRVGGGAALGALMAAGVEWTVLATVPGTTWAGLPTPTSLRALGTLLGDAPEVLRSAIAPIEASGTPLLLATIAAFAVGAAAAWSVLRLGGTLGPLVPTLTLFVAGSALGRGPYLLTTAAYVAAAAAYLVVMHQAEVAHQRTWCAPERGATRSRIATGALGAIVGVVAVGLAVGPRLPGASNPPLLDYRQAGSSGSGNFQAVTPIVDVRNRLADNEHVEVFTVQADQPAYWRVAGLDEFDGTTWGIPASDSEPPGALTDPDARGTVLRQRITTSRLAGPWVPGAYRPVAVSGLDDVRVISATSTLLVRSTDPLDASYSVESVVPTPSQAELERVGDVAFDDARFARTLALPDGFPGQIGDLAREIVQQAGADSPYERALALQAFLRSDLFTYSTEVPSTGSSDDALVDFLFDYRTGFCEQFAAAFGVMARSLGLPTRLAVGFTPGEPDGDVFRVFADNAHAWPEVYFDGIGWLAFEPTPGRANPIASGYTGVPDNGNPVDPSNPGSTTTSTTTAATSPTSSTPTTRPGPLGERIDPAPVDQPGGADAGWPLAACVTLGAAGALLTIGLLGATAVVLAKQARRRRRRQADTPRGRVIGAWEEALDRLEDAGITRPRSSTITEFARSLAPAAGAASSGAALLRLADLTTPALYGPDEPSDEDAQQAWELADGVANGLDANIRPSVRAQRRLRLVTFRRPSAAP